LSNDFYNKSGSPSTGSTASSAVIRSEYSAVEAAFDKLAAVTGNGGKLLRVNAGGTAYETINLNAGQILYGGASNGVEQSNNFTWNATNNTLAIVGNVTATSSISAGAGLGARSQFNGNTTSSAVVDLSGPAARLIGYGNSAGNRGTVQIFVSGAGGANAILALGIDVNGNTTLNTISATNVVASTTVNTPQVDSGSGTLLLKGAGSTAATITNANIAFAGLLTGTSGMLSPLNNSLVANMNLSNTSIYFDGPSVAQGNVGTWFASGTVSLSDSAGTSTFLAKLWDGTTVIDSTRVRNPGASVGESASLSGFISSPSGNIRISVRDVTATTGVIAFNTSEEGKDSTITVVRIG